MIERTILTLWNPQQAHAELARVWTVIKPALMAGHRLTLELRPEKRSTEQNRRMWAMLSDVADQVDWHGLKLDAEDWKHMFTASLKKQRVAPAIDGGGFVALGTRTSKMTKAEMSDLMELIAAFGAEKGVVFHDEG